VDTRVPPVLGVLQAPSVPLVLPAPQV
jgi:hypothetical protein